MTLTKNEEEKVVSLLHPLKNHQVVQRMKAFKQHGRITTYDHCERVARTSFWLNRRLHLRSDEQALVRGAMLHDLFLYDWHAEDGGTHKLHGFTHPNTALNNARKHFTLGKKEENIIASHMWPLTLRRIPTCREAVIVCVADKICSTQETLMMR